MPWVVSGARGLLGDPVLHLRALLCECPGVGLAFGLSLTGVGDQAEALQTREEL